MARFPQAVLLAFALVASAFAVVLLVAVRDAKLPETWGFPGFPALFGVTFSLVGYLIATRRRENPIGWIFLVAGALSGLQVLGEGVALYDAYGPLRLPGAAVLSWIDGWVWVALVGLAVGFMPALFPDGRPLSARWRPLLGLTLASVVLGSLAMAFTVDPLSNSGLPNPFVLVRLPASVAFAPLFALAACSLAAAASLGLRYRRAAHDERQQLKWLVSAGALVAVALTLSFLDEVRAGLVIAQASKVPQYALIGSMLLVPLAVGVAVLRYRLYEIDTIINRALVYGALTAVLGGTFVAGQLVLQKVFIATTGANSDLATVVALFAIAAFFTPVRARLQVAVDRRFKPEGAVARVVPASTDRYDQLEKLHRLRQKGALTESEFESEKAKLLR